MQTWANGTKERSILMTVHVQFPQFSDFQGKSLVTMLCLMKNTLALGLRNVQNAFRRSWRYCLPYLIISDSWNQLSYLERYLQEYQLLPARGKSLDQWNAVYTEQLLVLEKPQVWHTHPCLITHETHCFQT